MDNVKMCHVAQQFELEYGIERIDWSALCDVFRRAPLGLREPEKLKIAAENSYVVCATFIDETIIGFGRAISDGHYQSAVYDIVVLPEYQNMGVGKAIMSALLKKLPQNSTVSLFSVPGKQGFYEKFGINNLLTAMAIFPDPHRSREKGYIE